MSYEESDENGSGSESEMEDIDLSSSLSQSILPKANPEKLKKIFLASGKNKQ